jgi:cytochrome d ubiquinol oxidase subunit I
VAIAGPLAFVAIETGWMVTEIGRQPWIVQGIMRTSDAVTTRPGVVWHLAATIGVYLLLAFASVKLLLRLAGQPRDEAE